MSLTDKQIQERPGSSKRQRFRQAGKTLPGWETGKLDSQRVSQITVERIIEKAHPGAFFYYNII